jgi:hypothetical protein
MQFFAPIGKRALGVAVSAGGSSDAALHGARRWKRKGDDEARRLRQQALQPMRAGGGSADVS